MHNEENKRQNSAENIPEKTHPFATIGSTTERGGRVAVASSGMKLGELAVAVVGDLVVYDDSSEARIMDGAGFAAVWRDKPLALVGSSLSNGDRIVASLQTGAGIVERSGRSIPGLFDADYVQPPADAVSQLPCCARD
ncbi:PAAR domain-containing protein [Trinickia soli]|uniref:PAAR domain-containing protein n=1 Tax=Trinickia soli TaxID=380675 RepID=UPI003FA36641